MAELSITTFGELRQGPFIIWTDCGVHSAGTPFFKTPQALAHLFSRYQDGTYHVWNGVDLAIPPDHPVVPFNLD